MYPFYFSNLSKRVDDASICITVASDIEYSKGSSILLTKNEVATLIEALTTQLANMADAPEK